MSVQKLLSAFFAAVLFFAVSPAHAAQTSAVSDFYIIDQMPEGWVSSIPAGMNNDQHHSIGDFFSKETKSEVVIQIVENEDGDDMTLAVREVVNSLKKNKCTILGEPEPDNGLMRVKVQLSDAPSFIWIGVTDEYKAHTIATGNQDECRKFLDTLKNADPKLLPVSSAGKK